MSTHFKLSRLLTFLWFDVTFPYRFSFYTTIDPEELSQIFQIRYRVYCEENGYLKKSDYPQKKESDKYDAHSVQFVIRNKSDEIVAAARLILNSSEGFPAEHQFNINLANFANLPVDKSKLSEISRFIVMKKHRKHFLLLALAKGIIVYMLANGIQYGYFVLDQSLHSTLTRLGFPLKQVGETALYQGITTPYMMEMNEMLDSLHNVNPFFFRFIVRGKAEFNPLSSGYSIR